MLRIAICDDIKSITSQLEDILIELGKKHSVQIDIDVFYSGSMLIEYLMMGNSFHLIFLDIEMENVDGIQAGLKIRNDMRDENTQIAYISGKSGYAMDLFQVRPIDFIVKPLKMENIEGTFLTALRIINSKDSHFKYKKGHTYNKLEAMDIMYFEGNDRKINIITKEGMVFDSFYGSMDDVYEQIKDLEFLFIHKSYVVNNLYIKSYKYDKVIMANNMELSISQSKRKAVREKINNLYSGGE